MIALLQIATIMLLSSSLMLERPSICGFCLLHLVKSLLLEFILRPLPVTTNHGTGKTAVNQYPRSYYHVPVPSYLRVEPPDSLTAGIPIAFPVRKANGNDTFIFGGIITRHLLRWWCVRE
jgi:hypothetical protein